MISGCADFFAYPYPSLLIGVVAGVISVIGYNFLNRVL